MAEIKQLFTTGLMLQSVAKKQNLETREHPGNTFPASLLVSRELTEKSGQLGMFQSRQGLICCSSTTRRVRLL